MTEWRDIESAPRDGTWFIVYVPDSSMSWQPFDLSCWIEVKEKWAANHPGYFCMTDVSDELEGATHWMPLPDPPK